MSSLGSLFSSSKQSVPVNTFQPPDMTTTATTATGNIGDMSNMLTGLIGQYMPFMNTQTGATTQAGAAGSQAAQTTVPGATNVGNTAITDASNMQSGGDMLMSSIAPLLQGGQATLQNAFDPQSALYNRTFQQTQDQANVENAMAGVATTPYGAGVTDMTMANFNIDWQNQQLARQLAGLLGFGGAVGSAGGALGSAGTAYGAAPGTAQSGQGLVVGSAELPYATTAAAAGQNTGAIGQGIGAATSGFQPTIQDLLSYLGWGTSATGVYNQGQIGSYNATTSRGTGAANALGNMAEGAAGLVGMIPFPA